MQNTRLIKPQPAKKILSAYKQDLGAYDWWLVALVLMLLGVGLVMVLSASGIMAETTTGDKYYFFRRQVLFAGIGGLLLIIGANLPREIMNKWHYPALFIAGLMLILTLTPLGTKVNGASRWLSLKIFSIQPLEVAKIALVLYLAYFMSAKQTLIKTFSKGVIPPFLITFAMCGLLLLQPDFGGAVLLSAILFCMCLMGGTRFIYLFTSLVGAIGIAIALVIHSPYRARRLTAFLDPFENARDAGYQLVQSLYAFGSGGFTGVGLGASTQKMQYLPEAHNDFIMAILGEEWGFFGVSIVMLIFLLFFVRIYKIISGQKDLRDRLTAFGLGLIIALGALLNLAVVMGMAPPKGVPMPFISYGGSNLVVCLICVGLLLNYSRTVQNK